VAKWPVLVHSEQALRAMGRTPTSRHSFVEGTFFLTSSGVGGLYMNSKDRREAPKQSVQGPKDKASIPSEQQVHSGAKRLCFPPFPHATV
jgi:hypothetical protein